MEQASWLLEEVGKGVLAVGAVLLLVWVESLFERRLNKDDRK